MITEYIKEKSLYNYLKIAAKISEEAAFEIFIQIFKGLIFLNSNGICHRDIKSENIFFVNETNIKIADFSVIDYEKKGLCGTPGYMAPEIFKNETYDEKVDVFSLGVVLYSM